jgi:hypothetical protein
MDSTEKKEKPTENEKKEEITLEQRKEGFNKELNEIREKYKLDISPLIDFVDYKIIPEEVQLSLMIINKHRTQYIFKLVELKQDDN